MIFRRLEGVDIYIYEYVPVKNLLFFLFMWSDWFLCQIFCYIHNIMGGVGISELGVGVTSQLAVWLNKMTVFRVQRAQKRQLTLHLLSDLPNTEKPTVMTFGSLAVQMGQAW